MNTFEKYAVVLFENITYLLCLAGAGLNPMKTLPVCIDVGTNNPDLIESPLYLGLQHKRCADDAYFELMDEFLDAVYQV